MRFPLPRFPLAVAAAALLVPCSVRAQDERDDANTPGAGTVVRSLVRENREQDESSSRRDRRRRDDSAGEERGVRNIIEGMGRSVTPQEARGSSEREPRRASVVSGGIQADPEMTVLYFQPSTVTVLEGEEFGTTLELSNPRNRPFDRVALTLRHNDAVIETVAPRPEPVLREAEAVELRRSSEGGTMRCEILFPELRTDARLRLVTLRWRARREVRSTELSFVHEVVGQTFVGPRDGESILGNESREAPGLIEVSVRVFPDLAAFLPSESEGIVSLPWMDLGSVDEGMEGGVELALVPRRTAAIGEPLDVDVVVRNPEGAFVDDIEFKMEFDPETLEVEDTHRGNWIEQGVNIWDGGYHEVYDFDLHIRNEADNHRGVIRYHMGFSDETPLPSGTLATIRFRPLRSTDAMALAFDEENTGIRLLGEDRLGDPLEEGDGLQGVRIRIPRHSRPGEAEVAEAPPQVAP